MRAIVAAGVLAANPHDSQPWKFRLAEKQIDLHLDPERGLGPVDPFRRQMQIGAGCALENLVVAATAQGLTAATSLFPDRADRTLVARLELVDGEATPSTHFAPLLRRHTNRGPYHSARKLTADTQAALHRQVRSGDTALQLFDASSQAGRAFSEVILMSTSALIEDEVFMQATDAWFRWTPSEVRMHLDGPSLDSAGLHPLKRIAAQLGPRPSAERFQGSWLAATRDVHLATAAAFGAVCVRDPERPEQLVEAGRLWQRLHLEATVLGIGMQPLDQWLELIDRARDLSVATPSAPSADLAPSGFSPILMFRAGSPVREAAPSARRRLDDVLLP